MKFVTFNISRTSGSLHLLWCCIPVGYYWASEASPTLGCSIEISRDIREYGSTLYVGLARAVSPTNTNFRLTFLLTRLQEALYEDLAV